MKFAKSSASSRRSCLTRRWSRPSSARYGKSDLSLRRCSFGRRQHIDGGAARTVHPIAFFVHAVEGRSIIKLIAQLDRAAVSFAVSASKVDRKGPPRWLRRSMLGSGKGGGRAVIAPPYRAWVVERERRVICLDRRAYLPQANYQIDEIPRFTGLGGHASLLAQSEPASACASTSAYRCEFSFAPAHLQAVRALRT